jgi:hypothetical protein
MTRADVFNDCKNDFQALAPAWDAAVQYARAHPVEANEIMARDRAAGSKIRALSPRPSKVSAFTTLREIVNTSDSGQARADLRNHATGHRRSGRALER